MLNPTIAPPNPGGRVDCARELFAVAEALRRTGRHRRLRDITIVRPADFAAVAAVELACRVLSEGELSEAAADLDQVLDQLTGDPAIAERFLESVRGVIRRVGSGR
jgi:hypothetical protein